ncbi:MAG: class II aldolase/adducin family protein [Candidatus Puniceispirillaceae bacterium]
MTQDIIFDVDIAEARADMAALFRWTARERLHEGIANHFSMAVTADGQHFLMNPYGIHFSQIKASDLLLLDAGKAPNPEDDPQGRMVDITAWGIHGAMHRNNPGARVILHLHSPYATAFSCLKDLSLPPIDQTTARFFNRLAVDSGFDGMGIGEEGERLSHLLGNHRIMVMGNHGIMTVAQTPAIGWDLMYHIEVGCRNYMLASSSGHALSVMTDDVAEKTAQQWEEYENQAKYHMAAIRDILDKEEPDYAS